MNYNRKNSRTAYPILPVGMVKLADGSQKEYGSIWNLWPEDENETFVVLMQVRTSWRTGEEKSSSHYRAVITCDPIEDTARWHPIDSQMIVFHDQTGVEIGSGMWTVVGLVKNTREGVASIEKMTGRKSIPFSTFK